VSARQLGNHRRLNELRYAATDHQNRGLHASLVIDRATASRFGILPQAIDETLYDAFGQRHVSTIFTHLNQYRVVLEVAPRFQQDPDALKALYVRSTSAPPVPLSAFAHVTPSTTPPPLSHPARVPALTFPSHLPP